MSKSFNKRSNDKSNGNTNKKQKINSTRIKKRKKLEEKNSIDFINQEFEASNSTELNSRSRSKSDGSSIGSILSLDERIQSDIKIIDFDCRLIPENDACLRKNKLIPYNELFKKPGNLGLDLRKNDLIAKQYKVNKLAGTGTFSHVYLCNDIIGKKNIALKVLI